MSDRRSSDAQQPSSSAPQAPPLPSSKSLNVLQRMRFGPTKTHVQTSTSHVSSSAKSANDYWQSDRPSTSLTASHKTGLRIRAIDINPSKTHAILAGVKLLKTVRLYDDPVSAKEDLNIRTAVFNYDWARSSHHDSSQTTRSTELYDLNTAQRDLFDIEDVAWSSYNDRIATAARNGKIVLYDLNKPGVHYSSLHDHLRQVHTLHFNPFNGQWLLSGSQDGTVKFWDLRMQRPATTFPGRAEAVRHVRWSPVDSLGFVFCTDNGTVQHWSLKNNTQALLKLSAHNDTCSSISWHEDGRHLASAGHDKTVKIWDVLDSTRRSPIVSFRTPQEVQNLSWRPACYTRDWSSGDFIRSCTQVATSYRQYPFIHVWDLRRPFVPFREVSHRTNTCTTDMLWQSKDLLWTVGPEGDFEQHDIPFAPKPIDRRPPALARFSPTGQVLVVADHPTKAGRSAAHKAKTLPTVDRNQQGRSRSDFQSRSDMKHPSPDRLTYGRTPDDDGFENNFLTFDLRRKNSVSTQSKITLSSTPPESAGQSNKLVAESLREILDRHKPYRRQQVMRVVDVPGTKPAAVFKYLAQNLQLPRSQGQESKDLISSLKQACEHNSNVLRRANFHREGQAWSIMGHVATEELERKIASCYKQRLEQLQKEDQTAAGGTGEGKEQESAPEETENGKNHEVTGGKAMFAKLLQDYAQDGEAQLASHLFLLLTRHLSESAQNGKIDLERILPTTHPSTSQFPTQTESYLSFLRQAEISHSQAEAILVQYHSELMEERMYVQAADIRKLCVPNFPAVYEDTFEDVSLQFRCSSCGHPINNPRDKLICEDCGHKASECSYCWMKKSPYSIPGRGKKKQGEKETDEDAEALRKLMAEDPADRIWRGGSRLWQYCFLCGHMMHAACAADCWSDVSEAGTGGGCPVSGCGCACMPGYWRDEQEKEMASREAERARERVVGDEKVVGESRAVGRVRGALKESAVMGTAGKEGKKVRVVSPAGQKIKERAD